MLDFRLFLEDLLEYCVTHSITFYELSECEMKKHIKIMLKNIANSSHIKI